MSVLFLSLPGLGSDVAESHHKEIPKKDQHQQLVEARKKGGTGWYYLCHQLSRAGREHGDIFLNRFSIKPNPFSLTRYCIVNGEPEYIPQLTAEVLNAYLADWTIAKMNKERENCHKKTVPKTGSLCTSDFEGGRDFTFYSAESRVLGLQPGYWRLSKKLIKLRRMLNKNWELHRASIPTTISRFEKALDEIAKNANVEFLSITDYKPCFTARQKRAGEIEDKTLVFISHDRLTYRIDNQSIIDSKRLPRTHTPSLYWTPIQKSTALACLSNEESDALLKRLEQATNSKLAIEMQPSIPTSVAAH